MKLIIRYLLIANLLMKEMKHNENQSLVKSKLNYISRFRARLDIDIVVLQLDSSDEQAAAIRRELDARREKITEMERVSVSSSRRVIVVMFAEHTTGNDLSFVILSYRESNREGVSSRWIDFHLTFTLSTFCILTFVLLRTES